MVRISTENIIGTYSWWVTEWSAKRWMWIQPFGGDSPGHFLFLMAHPLVLFVFVVDGPWRENEQGLGRSIFDWVLAHRPVLDKYLTPAASLGERAAYFPFPLSVCCALNLTMRTHRERERKRYLLGEESNGHGVVSAAHWLWASQPLALSLSYIIIY